MKKIILLLLLITLKAYVTHAQCYIANSSGIEDISDMPTNSVFEHNFFPKLYPDFLKHNNNFIEDYKPILENSEILSIINLYESFYNIKVENYYFTETNLNPNAFFTPINVTCSSCDGSILLGRTLLWNQSVAIKNKLKDNNITGHFLAIEAFVHAIIAHELAHAYQQKHEWYGNSKYKELHADYFAGYLIGELVKEMNNDNEILDFYLEQSLYINSIFHSLGDFSFGSADHHGTPNERLLAYKNGFKLSRMTNSIEMNSDIVSNSALKYLKINSYSEPTIFNKSETKTNELFENAENYLILTIKNSNQNQFSTSKFSKVKLDINESKSIYISTVQNNQKNNILNKLRNLSQYLQEGQINPCCIDSKLNLNFECVNFDEYYTFEPDYNLAKQCAEECMKLGGKCDVLGNIYRFGRGVEINYLKAYDFYKLSSKRGDNYYEVNINEMTQDLLLNNGIEIKKDGSLGPKTKLAITKLIPKIGIINRILSREQFEILINAISK